MHIIEKARAMHRGELGLGQTFWLWFILPLWLLRLIVALATPRGAPDPVIILQIAPLGMLVLVINLAWFFYAALGVWRSAGHSTGFWSAAARVVVFLNTAYLVVVVLGTGLALFDGGLRSLWPIQYR